MQKLSYSSLVKIINDLSNKLEGNYINNVTLINSKDIALTFSNIKEEKLLISLNHNFPFLSFCKINNNYPTIMGKTNDILRKKFKDSKVEKISLLNEDRIVLIKVSKPNDYFEREIHYLVLEIIPTRSNLIVLDKEFIIEFALHYSSITNSNANVKNMRYEPIKKNQAFQDEQPVDLLELKHQAEIYLSISKENRLKEKYDYLFKYIKSRIKSLKNKTTVLLSEIERGKGNLIYQQHGTMLLALMDNEEEQRKYIEENFLNIDKDLTLGQNANTFFKRYKKAKRTIEMANLELKKSKDEIEKLQVISNQFKYMDDDDLLEIAKELLPHKFQNKIDKKKSTSKVSFVTYKGTKIYFGKNSKQNNELTFKIAKKDHYFFHIKDYHGAHIVVEKDTVDNELFLLAAEMALILSSKSAGDICYSKIKNVKKGDVEGKVNLLSYSLITLSSVREETYDILANHN